MDVWLTAVIIDHSPALFCHVIVWYSLLINVTLRLKRKSGRSSIGKLEVWTLGKKVGFSVLEKVKLFELNHEYCFMYLICSKDTCILFRVVTRGWTRQRSTLVCLFGAGRITRLNLTGRFEPGNNDAVRSLSNGHWVSVPLIVLGLALVGLVRGLGFCSDAKHCKRHNRPEA